MIYTETKDVMSGFPYKFRCRAYGKYDEEFSGVSPTGLDKEYSDLDDYDGFSYTQGVKRSINATRIGNPTITDDGILSGLSSSKYLKLETPFNPNTSTWEGIFKIKTGSTLTTSQVIFQSRKGTSYDDRFGVTIAISNNAHFQFWASGNGTGNIFVTTGAYTVLANTTYWVKIGWNGSSYYVSHSLDGITYDTDGTYTSSTPLYSSLAYTYVGCGAAAGGDYPFLGSIYLSECSLKTGSQYFPDVWTTVWEGTTYQCTAIDFSDTTLPWKWDYKSKLKTSLYAADSQNATVTYYSNILNGTMTGTLTISSNRVMSGFSTSNYLSKSISELGSVWEIRAKFKTSSSTITGGQKILSIGTQSSERKYALIFFNNAGTGMYIRTSSNGVDAILTGSTQPTVSNNTTYYIKIGSDGTKSYSYYSTTGFDNMTLIEEVNTPTTIPADTLYLGYEPYYTAKGAFGGTIDLGETYITSDDSVVWRGFDKITLQGCINGSSDTGGNYYCYAINGDDHIELVKKTGSVIDARPTSPRYLGEVSLGYNVTQSSPIDLNTPV